MGYKGTLSIVGDNGDPLPVLCKVTEHRMTIRTPDGAQIGDWGIREIGIQRDGDSFTIRAEGEALKLDVQRPDAFASALRLDKTEGIAERVAAARTPSPSTDRVQWRAVAAAVAALVVVGLVATAVLGIPPFNRDGSVEATPTTAEQLLKTITGTFTVHGGSIFATTGEPCFTEGGYTDIGAGTQVIVRDGSDGATLAVGELGGGQWALTLLGTGSRLRYCEFSLSVEDVPTGHEFYEIEVGRRGALTYTGEELEAVNWEVAFSIG